MSLYDTLTLLKSQMHTGHMTPETAMDSLYQAAMNLIQMPASPVGAEPPVSIDLPLNFVADHAIEPGEFGVPLVDDQTDPIDPDELMNG